MTDLTPERRQEIAARCADRMAHPLVTPCAAPGIVSRETQLAHDAHDLLAALEAAEARVAALITAVDPVITAWRGSNDVFPLLEILERVKTLSDAYDALRAEQPAPGGGGEES